ncbi:MAG: SDR family oxidoreductase [Acidimicrobiia bacterium]|nr:SDR family oxidoreductase [Acidimicrobiia bacterium]MDH5238704.1 SDR family oxidoreductase [Acidimicrobiia bacterium]
MAIYDFAGRTALVTGAAGSGIGRATAHRLLDEGASVVVTDLHSGRLDAVTAEFQRAFGDEVVMSAVMDAGDRDQIDRVLSAVQTRFGPIDVLVNNAAVNALARVGDMEPAVWDWAIGVNLSGPWYLSRAVLPAMVESGRGSIVNVTSVAGYIHGTNEGPYAAAKAALHQLTRTIATEYGPHGIRCNGVAPGVIHTWFVDTHAPQLLDEADRTPLRRLGTPDDIARVIAWLISDESGFVTGETINASGGWYMRP